MKNLEHLFMPYELALKLKEKHFNEPCLAWHDSDATDNDEIEWETTCNSDLSYIKNCTLPLYQQAVDWFREKYGVEIWVEYSGKTGKSRKRKYYSLVNYVQGTIKEGFFYNHKGALNKAIEEALKLI